MIKECIAYLKDNPRGYWFKAKLYGWGWVPVKWQGWLVVVIGVAITVIGVLLGIVLWHEDLTPRQSESAKIDCLQLTPKNLYPEGTGEFAGFDWSMLDRGSRDCEAYNQPFIDGCMEFVKQEKSYNDCVYDQSGIRKETRRVSSRLKTCLKKIGVYCIDGWSSVPVISASGEIINKQNPSFNDVIISSCGEGNKNPYKGVRVQWDAKVSEYAHTSGIRFRVLDTEHPQALKDEHELFWGIFLGSADDPRFDSDGNYDQEGLRRWGEKWNSSWVKYILDAYGGIGNDNRDSDTIFKVTATIENVDCDPHYDGGYIETSVIKIEKKTSAGSF